MVDEKKPNQLSYVFIVMTTFNNYAYIVYTNKKRYKKSVNSAATRVWTHVLGFDKQLYPLSHDKSNGEPTFSVSYIWLYRYAQRTWFQNGKFGTVKSKRVLGPNLFPLEGMRNRLGEPIQTHPRQLGETYIFKLQSIWIKTRKHFCSCC